MFIELLNIVNRTYMGISYGVTGGLFGTFIFSDYKKEMDNSDMTLKFSPFNRGTMYGYIIGFFVGYRLTKNLSFSN